VDQPAFAPGITPEADAREHRPEPILAVLSPQLAHAPVQTVAFALLRLPALAVELPAEQAGVRGVDAASAMFRHVGADTVLPGLRSDQLGAGVVRRGAVSQHEPRSLIGRVVPDGKQQAHQRVGQGKGLRTVHALFLPV
jgi:hypothetical protein